MRLLWCVKCLLAGCPLILFLSWLLWMICLLSYFIPHNWQTAYLAIRWHSWGGPGQDISLKILRKIYIASRKIVSLSMIFQFLKILLLFSRHGHTQTVWTQIRHCRIGIWSGFTPLTCRNFCIAKYSEKWKHPGETPKTINGLVQNIWMDKSTEDLSRI